MGDEGQKEQETESILKRMLDAPWGNYKPAEGSRESHPSKEWTPHIDTETGVIVARARQDDVDLSDPDNAINWNGHLRDWGFNPEIFTVEEPVEMRTWDAAIGNGQVERFVYFKARVRRRRPREDFDKLIEEIKKQKPIQHRQGGKHWFVVCLADWQLGKQDQGGSEGVVEAIVELDSAVVGRVRDLRRAGVDIGGIIVAGMGDIVEGCKGFYPNQPNQIDLSRREQITVARRLILRLMKSWSTLAPNVIVTAVPGNHGENRNRSGSFDTNPSEDNDDIAVFEQVAEMLYENQERYGHVKFVIPKDDESVTVDLSGTIVGFNHGHRAGSAVNVVKKVWEWWQKQTHALRSVGDAIILVTAHFHHLIIQQQGPRTWMQCPAREGGSDWYANRHGYETEPGTLTFTVGNGGWANLQIL